MTKFRSCVALAVLLLASGCAFSPVKRPDPGLYRHQIVGAKVIPLPFAATLNASKATAESIGFQIQAVSQESGVMRTTARAVQIPEVCDCGTWNLEPIRGSGYSVLIATVKEQSPGESTVTLENECGTEFTGRNLYGAVTRHEVYRCASRGQAEREFWSMLDQIVARAASPPSAPSAGPSASKAPALELVDARCNFEAGQLAAEGLVKNASDVLVESVIVVLMLYDEGGGFVGSEEGEVLIRPLRPGQASPFKILARRPSGLKCDFVARDRAGTEMPTKRAGESDIEVDSPASAEPVAAVVPSVTRVVPPAEPPVVNLFEYESLRPGMTYAQVVAAVGADGTEIARVRRQGVERTQYSWVNPDGSKMTATFRDRKLTTKVQNGLR